MDEPTRAQFDFQLNEPPVWAAAEPTGEALAEDAAAFMDAFANFKR